MPLTIFLCFFASAAIGDILSLFIYHLCNLFDENLPPKEFTCKNFWKNYLHFVVQQLQKNRTNFLLYYLSIDITTIACTLLIVAVFGITLKTFAALLFCYCLIILTFVDIKTQMLPDIITKPLIVLGLLQGYVGIFTDFQSSIIGALLGYFILWSVNTAFRFIRKKEGMGYGDFKLLSAIGAWVGYSQIPFLILSSSIIAIFVALSLARLGKNALSAPSPFGPSLAISGFVSLLWGTEIIQWYLGLFAA
jgi:leader peptidase (prepilin peptidase)/N-methyltransferase